MDLTAIRYRLLWPLAGDQESVFKNGDCDGGIGQRCHNLAAAILEHAITSEQDFRNHMDYVHYDPVKHGWVNAVKDWPYSTFHRSVKEGVYPEDWGGKGVVDIRAGER